MLFWGVCKMFNHFWLWSLPPLFGPTPCPPPNVDKGSIFLPWAFQNFFKKSFSKVFNSQFCVTFCILLLIFLISIVKNLTKFSFIRILIFYRKSNAKIEPPNGWYEAISAPLQKKKLEKGPPLTVWKINPQHLNYKNK